MLVTGRVSDDFSQEAAENKKPPNGMGLTESLAEQRSESDKSDLRGQGTGSPREDGVSVWNYRPAFMG